MANHQLILEKLTQITENEWNVISIRCREHIKLRVGHRTIFGAHAMKNLNESPYTYYYHSAIEKLYSGSWEWKFKKYTLLEQLIRIINSLISEEVRKYITHKNDTPAIENIDFQDTKSSLKFVSDNTPNNEDRYHTLIECIEKSIADDFELAYIFQCIRDNMPSAQIAADIGKPISYVYKGVEKLKNKVRKYIRDNNLKFTL